MVLLLLSYGRGKLLLVAVASAVTEDDGALFLKLPNNGVGPSIGFVVVLLLLAPGEEDASRTRDEG